jgi:hypothetical protein
LGDKIYDETDAIQQQQQHQRTDQRVEFDWDKLRLLDSKRVGTTLTLAERKAVVAFLRANYEDVLSPLNDKKLEEMVATTAVSEIDGDNQETMIYQKGIPSELCTVVLSGKLTVVAGKDEFRSEIGPWSVLATRALIDTTYIPDFSAYVSSRSCRCLRIHRLSSYGALEEVPTTTEEGGGNTDAPTGNHKEPEMQLEELKEHNKENNFKEKKSNVRSELLAVFNESVRSYGEIEKLLHGPTDSSIASLKSKLTQEGMFTITPSVWYKMTYNLFRLLTPSCLTFFSFTHYQIRKVYSSPYA